MSALLEAAAESRVVAGLRARIAQLEAVLHDYVQSDEERGLWFGVLGMAYANWPEQYDFQPDDAEHLRHWALIEIGFCDTLEIDGAMPHEAIIRIGLAFSHGKKHFRLARSGGGYLLRIPRSMKKGDIKAKEFRAMAERFYGLIEDITGITPDIYKREQDEKKRRRA